MSKLAEELRYIAEIQMRLDPWPRERLERAAAIVERASEPKRRNDGMPGQADVCRLCDQVTMFGHFIPQHSPDCPLTEEP